ncbi:MAG: hypothetical protein ACI9J3_003044 [Parvicellaceae bacterium]|jgi:hypothetical protein
MVMRNQIEDTTLHPLRRNILQKKIEELADESLSKAQSMLDYRNKPETFCNCKLVLQNANGIEFESNHEVMYHKPWPFHSAESLMRDVKSDDPDL